MNNKTLHINKPSETLLSLVRKLKENKEKSKEELRSKQHLYFAK